MRKLAIVLLLFVSGCALNRVGSEDSPQGGTIIQVPPPQTVNSDEVADKVGDKINATTNNLQSTLQGLVNASMSKLAEVVKGLEANFTANANVNAAATAEMRNKLESVIQMQNKLQADIQNVISINNKMQADLAMVNSLDAKLDVANKLAAKIEANANVNASLLNLSKQIETTYNQRAGHDVNMLPDSAVKLLLNNLYIGGSVIFGLLIVATIVIVLTFKASRKREADRTAQEREERQRAFRLLLGTMTHVAPERSAQVKEMVENEY